MQVADHLTLPELQQRVKKEKDPVARLRFLAIYHAKRGLNAQEIAHITAHTPRWVHATVRRYNQEGPPALVDRRLQSKPAHQPRTAAQADA